MSRFLVYVEQDYYPFAEVVEAASAEQAPDALEDGRPAGSWAIAVCPLEHVHLEGDASTIDGLGS
jgi:hypothetical protein